jgi:hypothetical protein
MINLPTDRVSIQDSLVQLSIKLEHPLDRSSAEQIYQNALDLLKHISPAPVTLARLAATLLVYYILEPNTDELQWFKAQIEQCLDEEEVEELIESIHRTDAL